MVTKAVIGALALAAGPVQAEPGIRTVPVIFSGGATRQVIHGTIRGYDVIDYSLRAAAGQTLSVRFSTSNRSSYFNVGVQGAPEALFNGAISGNRFSSVLAANGTYAVRVYLMRNAARRNETARYTLTLGLAGTAPVATAGLWPPGRGGTIDRAVRPAFCRGEVSGMYAVRSVMVKAGPIVVVPGEGSAIDGSVDKGAEGIRRFRCRFDARGRFIDVMAMTSDGE
ncbi:hypothetical protein [Rhizorhabdus phycosphaerae]|uniref:hypothetical protein n=1 Tax=Rhizorhabdus phycosphaerae TaxID=2711156 RepID=UPI0013EBE392|nr:hypothetical protein [Rhizorhabdus phycosphaerae]